MSQLDCPSNDDLRRLIEQQLDGDTKSKLETHVQSCPKCQIVVVTLSNDAQHRDLSGDFVSAGPSLKKSSQIDLSNLDDSFAIDQSAFYKGLRPKPRKSLDERLEETAFDSRTTTDSTPPDLPHRFSKYRILRLLGQGGMGQVYLAEDRQLHRQVALKVIKGTLVSDSEAKRFQAEAEAAAKLYHPNIVQIYEVGEERGIRYLTMTFIEGQTLAERVTTGPLPPQQAATIMRQLADAMNYAHEQGVIHRDLKPANIIVDASGKPSIMDFGLAKRSDMDSDLTQAGQIVGTPSYMSPEQAKGNNASVGKLSDVYSLGATLYCLLTGRPPFSASSVVETLRYIVEREPVPPRELNPAVPRDLETICLKCLDKRPEKRYESAIALGQDLQRFLDRRAILARPVSSIEKLVRWTQRNTILATTLSSASTLLIVALAVVSWSRLKVADSLKEESKQRAAAVIAGNEAKQRTKEERWSRYRANMSASANALQLFNVGAARRFLAEAPIEHRGWEWQHFSAQLDDAQLVLEGHQGDVVLVLFSPDGSRIATAGEDLTVRLWESNTGKAIATIRFEALIKSMAFSDDGTKLLCGSNRGCEFFDSNGIRLETQLSKNSAIEDMPIGRQSVQNFDGKVAEGIRFLDVNSGQPMLPPIIGQSILGCSADGALERIVTCGEAPEVLVWNTRTQQLERTLTGHTVFVGSVCFLPDGRHIASGGGYPDNFIQIWNLDDETANKKLVGHTNAINDLDVSSDGARIASGSFDQTAKLWDGHSGKELATLRGHTDWVRDVEFSPNNHYLATASSDHTVRLWKGDTGEFLTVLRGHTGLVNHVVFSPDSKWLASSSTDGTVRVWDVELMAKHGIFRGHTSFVYSVGFSADGRHIASCGWDSTVRVWDMTTVNEVACMTNDPLSININMTFNPDGSCIAAYARDYKVHWWNWKSQSLVRSLDPKSDCSDTGVAVSASGDRLACGSVGGVVRVWDPRSGEETMELKEEDATWIWDVAFDKTGERLAAANSLGNDAKCFIRIWDINSQKPMAELSGHTKTIHAVQFSNDGKWLASGSYDETVRIWNANTMELVAVLAHGSKVYDVSFSPDSLRLATGCADNTARLWDLTTFQQVAELRGHDAYVHSIAWSPDGTQLVTGSGDQTVRLWDTLSPRNRALKAMSQ